MQLGLYNFIVIIALSAVCASNAQAEIYTCKDAKGDTVYTDSPSACVNAEEIKTDALPTLTTTKPLATRPSSSVKKAENENNYTELVITSPSEGATIRDNNGNLTINFRVAPALLSRKEHKFVVTVGGAEVYSGTSTITALKNVDRGTHTIAVKVVDSDGSTKISATPVKFTLQRLSALNNDADSEPTITNQKFPSNTKFNRPATSPPPPGINN